MNKSIKFEYYFQIKFNNMERININVYFFFCTYIYIVILQVYI